VEGKSLDNQAISIVVFIIAVVCGVSLSLTRALQLAVILTFVPLFRVSVDLGVKELGLRPEDLLVFILLARVILFTPAAPMSKWTRRFAFMYGTLVAWLLVGQVVSIVRYPSGEVFFYLVQKAVGVTAFLFVTHRVVRTEATAKKLLAASLAGGLGLVIAVMASNTLYDAPIGDSPAFDQDMYVAKFTEIEYLQEWNPNNIGVACGALALVALALTEGARSRKAQTAAIACSALFTWSMLRSYTRTAIFAFATVIAFAILWKIRRLSRANLLVIGFVLLTGVVALFTLRREAFEFSLSEDVNVGSRPVVWLAAIDAIATHPFGYGVGTGDMAFLDSLGARLSAHNDWLDYALEMGIPGSLWALATFLVLGKTVWESARAKPGLTSQMIGFLVFAYFLICSLSLQVFVFSKQPFVLLAILLALANVSSLRVRAGGGYPPLALAVPEPVS
jgi:hypothetical protein